MKLLRQRKVNDLPLFFCCMKGAEKTMCLMPGLITLLDDRMCPWAIGCSAQENQSTDFDIKRR